MFLYVFFLCCVLQPILHYYCVFGKRESLQRFLVEDGVKPAIFGSYSYDPVKQLFVPPPSDPEIDKDNDKSNDKANYKDKDNDKDKDNENDSDKAFGKDTDKDKAFSKDYDQNSDKGFDKDKGNDKGFDKDKEEDKGFDKDKEKNQDSDKDKNKPLPDDVKLTVAIPVDRSGADHTKASKAILRKHIEPTYAVPWWAQSKKTFKNVTLKLRLK